MKFHAFLSTHGVEKGRTEVTQAPVVRGSLPEIIRNDEGLYVGNLIWYFQVIFNSAQNLLRPYHNFRHMFHVFWRCYEACVFYAGKLTPRQKRNLLIAALFHDFDHSGMLGEDDLNIVRAVRGLKKHVAPEDRVCLGDIIALMEVTEFPYKVASEELPLDAQIIRDADLSQALDVAWIQQVIFGLAAEWGKKPIEILRSQGAFHRSLKLHTDWGRQAFPQTAIAEKIAEAEELLNLLETKPSATA